MSEQTIKQARLRVAKAEQHLRDVTYQTYAVGALIRYAPASYDLIYKVVDHSLATFGSPRLKVVRYYAGGSPKPRWISADSDSVRLYRKAPTKSEDQS